MGMREGEQLLPFAKLFYGDPSTYLWEDEPCSSASGNMER